MSQQIIIDAHTHIFPRKIAPKATQSIGQFYGLDMNADGMAHVLLEQGDENGIAMFLICSVATKAEQVRAINDFVAQKVRMHPDRFVGLGALHPDMEDPFGEIERIIELGLRGIKLHPDFQLFDIDDARMLPVYRYLAQKGLPVLFHTGDARYDYSRPKKLARVARAVPDLKCIAAHFGGFQRWGESYKTMALPNVWVDTSSSLYALKKEQALALIERFGEDKVLFGTDFPMWEYPQELQRFYDLRLGPATCEKIFYQNFLALFDIPLKTARAAVPR